MSHGLNGVRETGNSPTNTLISRGDVPFRVIAPSAQAHSREDVNCVKTIKIHLSRERICEQTSRKLPRADSRACVTVTTWLETRAWIQDYVYSFVY